jgi:hypothetical protein
LPLPGGQFLRVVVSPRLLGDACVITASHVVVVYGLHEGPVGPWLERFPRLVFGLRDNLDQQASSPSSSVPTVTRAREAKRQTLDASSFNFCNVRRADSALSLCSHSNIASAPPAKELCPRIRFSSASSLSGLTGATTPIAIEIAGLILPS